MARELVAPIEVPPAAREPRRSMGYDAWRAWAPGSKGKSEWVAGEAVVVMPASVVRARLVRFLLLLSARFLAAPRASAPREAGRNRRRCRSR